MKPFYGTTMELGLDMSLFNSANGTYYNGFYLEIDPSIYPINDIVYIEKINAAMFRLTSFLNTLPLVYVSKKYLKITGFNDYSTFKIEALGDIRLNGLPFNVIYKEDNDRPSIITK